MEKLHLLQAERAKAFDALSAFGMKDDFDKTKDAPEYGRLKGAVEAIDEKIARFKEIQEKSAATAQPAPGQEPRVPAAVENDHYVKNKSLVLGGIVKMMGAGGGGVLQAREVAREVYGENHPVTKALITSSAAAGGLLVPPDYMNEIIPLLRAQAVVRAAGPRMLPMPRGTMTIPGQAAAATASYGNETKKITQSQQPAARAIVASFKKLTALVPVSNDMLRYADPAADAFVRDDLVKVMALREDMAFLLGDGTQDAPRGFLSFANGHVQVNGGTLGAWSTGANSVFAVNGATVPAVGTSGNFITSTQAFTLDTVQSELAGAKAKLDKSNVSRSKRAWFFNSDVENYLFNVRNALGLYVFRDEMAAGKLLGFPFFVTNQLGSNYYNTDGSHTDCTFVFLVAMDEDIVLDSMQLEIAVSRDGSYTDASGAAHNAFEEDQTLLRAISEHDHQLRHLGAAAVIQGVRWAPAIG